MAGYNPQLGRQFALEAARRYGINPDLFVRQLTQESGFRADAVSPVGARGPGQIMPATWQQPGYGLSFGGSIDDPYANIDAAAQYQRAMLDANGGDPVRALASYNWGAGNVQGWDGDPAKLPAETRNYVQSILGSTPGSRTPTKPTLAQEAADMDEPGRNSPVTLDQEKKPKGQIHLGLGLSSLGAALAASARGESAMDELSQIRGQYFEEQDAIAARAAQERARIAAINMVGADTQWGQALAAGADPEMVMADYQRAQAQQHAETLQAQGFGHDYAMAGVSQGYEQANMDRRFGYDRALQESEFDWRTGERVADQGFTWRRDEAERDHGSSLARDEREWRSGENELDRDVTVQGQEDEMVRWRTELAIEADQIAKTDTDAISQGNAYRDLLIEQADALGDTPTVDWLRTQPPQVFNKESVDFFAQAVSGDDVQQGLRATRQYFELQQTSPEAADQFAKSMGWKVETSATNTNLSPDTRLNSDGTATIIPGSPTDLEMQLKQQEADAEAREATNKNSAQTDNTIAAAKSTVRSLARSQELVGWGTTGWRQQLFGGVGGFDPHQLREELSTVKANISFDRLTEMRAASPTGGALGNVTEGELKLLSDTIAAISPTQDPDSLRENLGYVTQQYNTILQKIATSNATPEQKREAMKAMGADDADIEQLTPGDDGMLTDPTTGRRYRVR